MNELNNKSTLRLLSDDELRRIHAATLEVLETTGVKFLCPEAIEVFRQHGLRRDRRQCRVFHGRRGGGAPLPARHPLLRGIPLIRVTSRSGGGTATGYIEHRFHRGLYHGPGRQLP